MSSPEHQSRKFMKVISEDNKQILNQILVVNSMQILVAALEHQDHLCSVFKI